MSKKSKGSSVKKSDKKKTAKPVKKNSVKKAPAKKAVAKKSASVKKTAAKKTVKPKGSSKPVPKKEVKKVIAKKPAPKATKVKEVKATKAEKPVKLSKPVIEKKPEVKPAKEVKVDKAVESVSKKAVAAAEAKNASTDVLAISNTIPKQEVKALSASKIASISSSITNPVKKVDSYSVKVEKEPNGKYEMEILVRSSPEMLYEFLSTPSGLSEWFCDDVNIRNGIYTFIWDGQLQQARLLKTIDDQLVRFQWVDKTDGSYFEFRIQRDDLTNDISLIITDFAESVSERESAKRLWQSQVEKLMHIIGSIF